MRKFLLSVVLLSLSIATRAQNFDIAGFKLGASYDEAVAKLTSDGYHISKVKFPWPDMTAVYASRNIPSREGFVVQAVRGKVVYIDHTASFARTSGPNMQDTVSAVKSKYGETQTHYSDNVMSNRNWYNIEWHYDAAARVHSDKGTICAVEDGTVNTPDAIDGLVLGQYVMPLTNCTTFVKVEIFPSKENVQIVGTVKAKVADLRTMRSFFVEKANETKGSQDKEGAAAKKVKPPV